MKKSIIGIVFVFFTFNSFAQRHEIFVKLNQLNGYSAKFENKENMERNDNRVINALNYAIGYNYFFNANKYIGASFGYIPRKSSFLTEREQGNELATSNWQQKQTHYTLSVHVGRLFQVDRFKFYSEGGAGVALYRNIQIVNSAHIYDKTTNVLIRSAVETENTPNANEYQFKISQGVYYSVFNGFAVGVDLPMVFYWYKLNGPITTHTIRNNSSGITETNTSVDEKTTTYNFGISPTLGIRYTF